MERSTWRKILTVFFSFVLTATLGAALAACTTDEEPTAQEGPETGLYYYDADDGDTYYITLSDADRVSMQIRGERISGSYMLGGLRNVCRRRHHARLRRLRHALSARGELYALL